MAHYSARYSSCYFCRSSTAYGRQYDSRFLFNTNQLHSRTTNIFGHVVSDYTLIKSRCNSFYENYVICPYHRYLYCVDYMPPRYCTYGYCYSTRELVQNTPAVISGNSLPTVTTQHRYDDYSSYHKREGEISGSTDIHNGRSDYSLIKNVTTKDKIHSTLCTKQDDNLLERNVHSDQQHQTNMSMSKGDVQVTQETETNQGNQTRKFTKRSSSSKSPHVEPMEAQTFVYINICASSSTRQKCEEIIMPNTETFETLKVRFIETFGLNYCPNDLSLLYVSSHLDDNHWKIMEKEKEKQLLAEWSPSDNYIVTCTPSKYLENESMCVPYDAQHSACLTEQNNVYPLPGLQNLGNTCYMNSALQCLNHVKSFFNYFRDTKIKTLLERKNTDEEKNSILTRLYSELIESFCSLNDGALTPVEFYMEFRRLAPRFCDYRQHDSLEFMNILLDILHEELMQISQRDHTIVSKTFYGQIRAKVTCKSCELSLQTDDSFSFLPLPIPEKNNTGESSHTRGYKLDHCFQTFLQGEQIGNHGQWHCEHCNKLTHARKEVFLCKLPPVLILQLKRFNYDLQSYTKIDTPIEYDLDNLDLNEYVVQENRDTSIRYNLIAVSNHWGNLIGGHFVTYAKLPETQDWYRYDDDRVGKMDKSIHRNNYSAYILVYQQEKKDSIVDTSV